MPEKSWKELMDEAGGDFEPIPVGTYDAEIIKAEYKHSTTGKEMYVASFKITAGPHANRQVFNNFVLTPGNPNALRFFFQHMNVLGLGEQFFASNPAPEQVAESLKGRTCQIKVKHRTYQGRTVNEVEQILPAGGVPNAPPAPGTAPAPPAPPAAAPAPEQQAVSPPPPPPPAPDQPPPPPPQPEQGNSEAQPQPQAQDDVPPPPF